MQVSNYDYALHKLINNYISLEMLNGCSNSIFENEAEVIKTYNRFTLWLQIQMKQFLLHIAYCIDIWIPVSQLTPLLLSKVVWFSNGNTHRSSFLLYTYKFLWYSPLSPRMISLFMLTKISLALSSHLSVIFSYTLHYV